MKVEIDVNPRRDLTIALNGLNRVNDAYTFYCDETNNPRRLHVTADGFNVEAPPCFVLGGNRRHMLTPLSPISSAA